MTQFDIRKVATSEELDIYKYETNPVKKLQRLNQQDKEQNGRRQ